MSDPSSTHRKLLEDPNAGRSERDQTHLGDIRQNRPPAAPDELPTVISKGTPRPVGSPGRVSASMRVGEKLLGQRLGHLTLDEFVGGGGMGAVFRATDTLLGRTVAVKVLSQEQAADEDTLLRFRNEAQSAARLDHQNIARAYYVGEDQGLQYIVFEFIDGVNVRDLVEQRGSLSLAETISIALQMAEALDHAYNRDVVHRDIKPSNILITDSGQAKLVDMGLARLHQMEHSGDDLTASGVTLGTFDYISPEQARDPRMADVRSDIYSLGCTVYFMLTGRPPFPEGTVLQKLLQHQGDAPPDLHEFRPDLPDEALRVVGRMLAKSPDQRYQVPQDLIRELARIAHRLGLKNVSAGSHVWVAPRRSRLADVERHLPWAGPIASLCVFVLVMHYVLAPSERALTRSSLAGASYQRIAYQPDEPPAPAAVLPAPVPIDRQSPPSDQSSGAASSPTAPAADSGLSKDDEPLATGNPPGSTSNPPGSTSPPLLRDPFTVADSASSEPTKTDSDTPARDDGRPVAARLTRAQDDTSARLDGTGGSGQALASATVADSTATTVPVPGPPRAARTLHVVRSDGRPSATQFATLAEALAAATDGDTIQLDRAIVALASGLVVDKRVTIQPGPEQTSVQLQMDPAPDLSAEDEKAMLLVSGNLKLQDLHLRLRLGATVRPDGWAMARLTAGGAVDLERCSMTIESKHSPQSPWVAPSFFLLAEDRHTAAIVDERLLAGPARPAVIRLADTIARGPAVLVRSGGARTFELTWQNGFLATSESLIALTGSEQVVEAPPSTVRLSRVTGLVRTGVFRSRLQPQQSSITPVRFHVDNCILQGEQSEPMIEQQGTSLAAAQQSVSWQGAGNYYENFQDTLVWRIVPSGVAAMAKEFGVRQWQGADLTGSSADALTTVQDSSNWNQALMWKKEPPTAEPEKITPDDFTLDTIHEKRNIIVDGQPAAGFLNPKPPVAFPVDESARPSTISVDPAMSPAAIDGGIMMPDMPMRAPAGGP